MHERVRTSLVAAALVVVCALPATAQKAGAVLTDLMTDVTQVEKKMLDLAKALPADKYDWRPAEGVRSIGEVLLHVSADNYLLPAMLGIPADASTGIKADDYKTAVAFENRKMSRDAIIAELEKSFAHLKKSLSGTSDTKLGDKVSMFGQTFTVQQTWILTTTHVHEHLGQMIAYARSNGVKPPWS